MSELLHYGVKGMKWGHHKPESVEPTVIRKGSRIQNISGDRPRSSTGHVYGSFTKMDNLNYRGYYAHQTKFWTSQSEKAYENVFEAKKDIRLADHASRLKTFEEMYNKDSDTLLKSLAYSEVTTSLVLSMGKTMKLPVEDWKYKQLRNKGKKLLDGEGEYLLTKSFAVDNPSAKEYKRLLAKKFDGMIDTHDQKEYGSEAPILIFKGQDALERKSTRELSEDEINEAIETYKKLGGK